MGKAFAIVNIILSLGACLGYLAAKDWRHAIYWGSAAILTGSVTF